MTLNPVVHMGIPGLVAFALIGIAWGMMPVDPTRLRGRYAEAAVAAAGPFMNLSLAVLCLVLLPLWMVGASGHWSPSMTVPREVFANVAVFFHAGAMLNIVLFLFNLLPVPPLDGARIVGNFVPAYFRLCSSDAGRFIAIAAFIGVFLYAGRIIFPAAMDLTDAVSGTLADLLRRAGP
jgi:Zn-dependent protease